MAMIEPFKLIVISLAALVSLVSCSPTSSSNATVATGIVGGQNANYKSSPASSVVAIFDYASDDEGLVFECSGVVISKHLILTAAHCITSDDGDGRALPPDTDRKVIYFGSGGSLPLLAAKYKSSSLLGAEPFRVATAMRIHPHYAGAPEGEVLEDVAQNDIALLRVDDIPPTAQIATLLTRPAILKPHAVVKCLGFGPTLRDQKLDQIVLRSLQTKIRVWEPGLAQFILTTTGDHSVISGDSGGPTFIETKAGPRLWGLNSAALDEVKGSHPTYTEIEDIVPQLGWIKSEARDLSAPLD